jgi:hypothetical protein
MYRHVCFKQFFFFFFFCKGKILQHQTISYGLPFYPMQKDESKENIYNICA